jgi:hypothetical protein
MRWAIIRLIAVALIARAAIGPAAWAARAFISNEDSHPHEVAPGASARFTLEPAAPGDSMAVKCTLSGDAGHPVTSITLRTSGLEDVRWPFATRTIHIERQIDFDILARISPATTGAAYFEFVNGDPARLLWHQCYNN